MRGLAEQLVAEIAGEPGARHPRRASAERVDVVVERREPLDIGQIEGGEDRAGPRTLERDRGDRRALVLDRDVEAQGRVEEPVEVVLLGAEPEGPVLQAVERAVVEDLAVVVAPQRVAHPARPEAGDRARREPIDEALRVSTPDPVLVERAQIEERRRVSDREVLLLDLGVDPRRRVAGPASPVPSQGERPRAGGERRVEEHGPVRRRLHGPLPARTARAAFAPGSPLTPPPGWLPAPPR